VPHGEIEKSKNAFRFFAETGTDMSKSITFGFHLLISFSILIVYGCASHNRYSYDLIKEDYLREKETLSSNKNVRPESEPIAVSGSISLKKAVQIALRNNPEIDMAIARIRQSEATIHEALSSFWPVISVSAEYLQGDAPSIYLFKTIDQRALPTGVDFNNPGWFQNVEFGIQGRYNLFNGGGDMLRKRMAETGLTIHELDRLSVENALVESVIHAYYNTLAASDFIQIAENSVDTVAAQLRIMNVRYKAGGALKSDILSLEVRLAQTTENLVRAQNNRSLSLAALANLLGADPDANMEVSEETDLSFQVPKEYKAGLLEAMAHRPELKKVRQQIVQSKMTLDLARAEYFPTLDAHGRYYLDDEGLEHSTSRANWVAGVILNWDLFTGFGTRSRVEKQRRVLEEMLAVDRKTTQAIQLDLKTAYLRLEEAKARHAVAKASVNQAEESLNLVKKQYEGGSATITRYLDAELARNRARMRSTIAFYDGEKARASVGRALGYWAKVARGLIKEDE
jgi:outer membrane protein TolC